MSATRDDRLAGRSCVDVDPNLFFSTLREDERAAKAVCQGCPVREVCLEIALTTHQEHGVWGGLTEKERRSLKRRLRRARAREANALR